MSFPALKPPAPKSPALAILIAALLLFPAASSADNARPAKPVYSQIRVHFPDQAAVESLAREGVIFDHAMRQKTAVGLSFEGVLDDAELAVVRGLGLRFDTLIPDLEAAYAARPAPSDEEKRQALTGSSVRRFDLGSLGGMYTYAEMVTRLDDLRTQYPTLISAKTSIGTSVEGRSIWMVKVSDNPDIDEAEPEALYDAMHHAREPVGMMTLIYFIEYLLENYGSDPEATFLVDERELYFVPIVNPDGYVHNETNSPGGGGLWRKNRRDNGGGSFGVDLNRNYGYQWGFDDVGSSPSPNSNTYRGPSAFSEPETQALRDLALAHDFAVNLSYHTFGNLLLYPWGYEANLFTPDHDLFVTYGAEMTRENGYLAGTANQTVGYVANGGTFDWMYGEQTQKDKIFSLTPEVGTSGFWPPVSEIVPQVEANLAPNLFLAWAAGGLVRGVDYSVADKGNGNGFPDPGEAVEITLNLENVGLGNAEGVSAAVVSDDPYLTVVGGSGGPAVDIPSRGTAQLGPFEILVSEQAPAGHLGEIRVRISQNGVAREQPLQDLVLGTPIFFDAAANGTTGWTIGQGWGTTDAKAYSPPESFTDSPVGDYEPETDSALALIQPIDLSGASSAKLHFRAQWDIEFSWDFAQVQVSNNSGVTWTPLPGLYTVSGSGRGVQTAGEPGYEGRQTQWVREVIDLSAYAGQGEVRLRFVLQSDDTSQRDGWYIDDVSVFADNLAVFADGFESGDLTSWDSASP